jgi:ATP-dependent DNA ligase
MSSLRKIQEFGFEGVIAKRKDSIYVPGAVPGSWLKKKLKQSEEFIIGGYEPGKGMLEEIAVGRFAGKEFNYVALVDDGFVPNTRRQVIEAIKKLRTAKCPFVNVPEKKGMHRLDRERMQKLSWVKPKVVVEIAMNEWTPDRHLRPSEFKHLRTDKSLKDVAPYPKAVSD